MYLHTVSITSQLTVTVPGPDMSPNILDFLNLWEHGVGASLVATHIFLFKQLTLYWLYKVSESEPHLYSTVSGKKDLAASVIILLYLNPITIDLGSIKLRIP